MSQIGPHPAKTAKAQVNPKPALGWEVFVTPGIPIVTPDRPPGVRETFFQAMASTLIYGARDAVLVDERADGVHLSYDRMASFLAPYGNAKALTVARDLDSKVETLLRKAAS